MPYNYQLNNTNIPPDD